jgi:hypothetical protein
MLVQLVRRFGGIGMMRRPVIAIPGSDFGLRLLITFPQTFARGLGAREAKFFPLPAPYGI